VLIPLDFVLPLLLGLLIPQQLIKLVIAEVVFELFQLQLHL
jgi:hypothetical protein